MPLNDHETILQRIRLIVPMYAKGLKHSEISEQLRKVHKIDISESQVGRDLENVRKGIYIPDTWLDDLLDINYPTIFAEVIQGLNEDLEFFKEASENADKASIQLKARKFHADTSINMLAAMHKGPVVREMRKLRKQSRKMVEELATERAITRKNEKDVQIIEAKDKLTVSPAPPGEEPDIEIEEITENLEHQDTE